MSNFRPSTWWFGLLYMLRGALLSLPAVIATNTPGLNMVLMGSVLQVTFTIQLYFLPWKAPLLNLIDAVSTALFLILLALCLHVEPLADDSVETLDAFGVAFYYCSLGVVISVVVMSAVLSMWQRCTSKKGELKLVNLGRVPNGGEVLEDLEQIVMKMQDIGGKKELFVERISHLLSTYDLWTLRRAMDILLDDCGLGGAQSSRVAASRRSHFRASLQYLPPEAEDGAAKDNDETGSVSISF